MAYKLTNIVVSWPNKVTAKVEGWPSKGIAIVVGLVRVYSLLNKRRKQNIKLDPWPKEY